MLRASCRLVRPGEVSPGAPLGEGERQQSGMGRPRGCAQGAVTPKPMKALYRIRTYLVIQRGRRSTADQNHRRLQHDRLRRRPAESCEEGQPDVPQRVILVFGGKGPDSPLRLLLSQQHQLQVIRSPAELATGGPSADVIVVDVPAQDRRVVCEQLRRRYRGRLLVLLDPEDSRHDLPPDPNRTLLTRPFGGHELSVALAGSAPFQPSDPWRVLPRRAQVGGADSSLGMEQGMVAKVVPWLARSWRERRLVWVSMISATAALVVMVAFVLVTRGGCGSACDELADADRSAPSSTTVSAVAVGPATTASSVGPVGPTTTISSVGPTTDGGNPVDAASGGTAGNARTTAGSSGAPSPTSPSAPSRPPPTAPSTIASTTTSPKPSTTTTATTTTTTTTTTLGPQLPSH